MGREDACNGFHSIDFPKKGGKPLPLILPTGKTVTGVLDFAKNPFWFNGKVPEARVQSGAVRTEQGRHYNGSKAIDSGLPVEPKVADFKLKFTKAGTYKYYCNVHPGMVGVVVVLVKGKKVPSAKDDAKTLAKGEAAYIAGSKKLVKTKPTRSQRRRRRRRRERARAVRDGSGQAHCQERHHGEVLDAEEQP